VIWRLGDLAIDESGDLAIYLAIVALVLDSTKRCQSPNPQINHQITKPVDRQITKSPNHQMT
jgi:hypothetical protein